jgi:multiple sugar transport system permease protein
VLLAPALLLISVFSYYPIFKALPIAFQDYNVTGSTAWVGSANFVEVFSNPATWISLLKTAYYMILSIGFGFLAPVVLAVLMSEIQAFRYFLRTVYYLPAVVAGIVMLLLWQRFFEPTPDGMVNRLYLAAAGFWNAIMPAGLDVALRPIDWLRDPIWGIPSVVFVGIWGGMGPGMLIYLAALKSIPEDLYEASEIDGATWRDRLYHITLSYLRPLLVINLIGAVISAFQASGNILALSGNFPATYTFAVHLWFETFGLGNFGVGTALSWIMAAILMGFTLWQLRILRSVEFRRAEAD